MLPFRTGADAERPDARAVLRDLPLGRRVVVRFLIEHGERATDAVGELVGRDERSVRVRTRSADVRIELAQVVAAKQVPASPGKGWRVAPFLRRGDVAVLGKGTWRASDGSVLTAAIDLVQDLLRSGRPVFVLGRDDVLDDHNGRTPGTAEGRRRIPLLAFLGDPGELTPEVFARTHQKIEDDVGRTVGRARVHYTDARPDAVDTARVFGWQGRVFTPPPGTRGP